MHDFFFLKEKSHFCDLQQGGNQLSDITINIPPPNPKQRQFLADTHRYVGYGGARGGGKSWAVRVKAVLLCLRWAGIKVLIIRRTYKELLNNHIAPLQAMLPKQAAVYNKSEKAFTFYNGATISFGYCHCDRDLDRYQGAEYDVVFFDEATQLKEDWLKKINLTVRQPNGLPKRTYYTCNPGGVSHNYMKRLFIDRRFMGNENPEQYHFIPALVTDNKVLTEMQPDYVNVLEGLPPKLRKAWLEGDWNVFEGQFFEDFCDREDEQGDGRYTHVITPFEIPAHWPVYRSFDWGYSKPFSCGWWTVDPDGVVYRILELYGCDGTPDQGVKWPPDRVFAEIAKIEREHRWLKGKQIVGVADPAIWDGQRGVSIADVAGKYGVYFHAGDHKRLPGWMQVHYRLAFDDEGFPKLYVFRHCKAMIRTFPLLQFDPHRPEDLDTTGEDHVADEVRYFLMSRPIAPTVSVGQPTVSGANYLDL